MAKIRINQDNTGIFPINSYNRNTTFDNGEMTSYAYISAQANNAQIITKLQGYGITGVSQIDIYNDQNDVIYTLSSIDGRISALDETLNGTEINLTINIQVRQPQQSNP
jgi:hypothetical protein